MSRQRSRTRCLPPSRNATVGRRRPPNFSDRTWRPTALRNALKTPTRNTVGFRTFVVCQWGSCFLTRKNARTHTRQKHTGDSKDDEGGVFTSELLEKLDTQRLDVS